MGESLPFVIDDDSESQQSKPRHTKTKVSDILQNADDNEQETNKSQRRGAQFKAMFYRRWIGIKRSIVAVIINILITLVVSCLAIIVKILMDSLSQDQINLYNFKAFPLQPKDLAIVASDFPNNFTNKPFQQGYINVINDLFYHDLGYDPVLHIFPDYEECNKFLVECKQKSVFVAMGIGLPDEFNPEGPNNLTMLWNDSMETNVNSIIFPNMS